MKKTGNGFRPWLFAVFVQTLVVSVPAVASAQVKVEASVDRNRLNQGDTLVLTVAVSSEQSVSVSEPRLPALKGFQLLQRWTGTEARSTFANGQFQTVRTQKFNYQLMTPEKGKWRIGPVDVVVNGNNHRTRVIDIEVVAGGAPPPVNNNMGQFPDPTFQDPFEDVDDLFNQLLGRQRRGTPGRPVPREAVPEGGELFSIHVEVDKKKVYEGEQITASWYLITQGQVRDIDTLKYPSLNGFWKEDIEIATHLNFQRDVINGIIYKKALLASYALFPIKAGNAEIDPYQAKITAFSPDNFGFGFGRPVTATKSSVKVPVTVMPLPEGKPESFTGAVGQFEVSAQVDQTQVKTNQPVSLKVRFEGRGNAKVIELPKLPIGAELEIYDTKKDAKYFKDGRSYKEFEILLIPRQQGQYTLPEMTFAFFDPAAGQYVERTTAPISLLVLPGESDGAIPSTPLAVGEEAKEKPAVKDETPQALLQWRSYSEARVTEHPALWGFIVTLMLGALTFKARRELGREKKKGLGRIVKDRFEKIHGLVKQGDWRAVGAETANTVYFVLGDVSGEGGANIELDKLLLRAPPSVRREFGPAIKTLMESFMILGFAPEGVVGALKEKENMKKLVKETEKVMMKVVKMRMGEEEEEKS